MKAAFRIDFGKKTGVGHLTRMSALADALAEYDVESTFFSESDEPIDYGRFDIAIADSYLLSDTYINALNDQLAFVICYDDNALYRYSCDILINANFHAKTLPYRFGDKKPRLMLGGEYALLRKEFWHAEPIVIKREVEKIMLIFGGTDHNDFTETAICALKDAVECEIVAIFGSLARGHSHCKARFERDKNITIIQSPSSISDVMRDCDMAITAGGSTIYELAVLGIPSLIVPQAENQLLGSAFCNTEGLMKSVGWWADFDPDKLRDETNSLQFNFERRKAESEKLKSQINPQGARLLAEAILDLK